MEAPTPKSEEISETITIEQHSAKYTLHLNSIGDIITFSLDYNSNNYTKKIPLKEIKDSESKTIFNTFSAKDFFKFLKKSAEMKKLDLIKKDNSIDIKLEFEAMLEKHEVNIELVSKDQNLEMIEKELKELKVNYDKSIIENKELKKRIENLENEMKENEFDLIHLAIKSRLNKEVKELKKLYQATIDGDGGINFHSRCDNIPNTLVLIKSAGNRRFGGFTTVQWSSPSSYEYKDDPNAFLFSLDKQKFYSYKKMGKLFVMIKIMDLFLDMQMIYI